MKKHIYLFILTNIIISLAIPAVVLPGFSFLAPPNIYILNFDKISYIPSFENLIGMVNNFNTDNEKKSFLDQWFIVSLRRILKNKNLPDNIGFIGLSKQQATKLQKRNLTGKDFTDLEYIRYRDDGEFYSAVDVFGLLVGREWRNGFILMFDRDNKHIRRLEDQYEAWDNELYTRIERMELPDKKLIRIPRDSALCAPIPPNAAVSLFPFHEGRNFWTVAMAMRHFLLQVALQYKVINETYLYKPRFRDHTTVYSSLDMIGRLIKSSQHQIRIAKILLDNKLTVPLGKLIQMLNNDSPDTEQLDYIASELENIMMFNVCEVDYIPQLHEEPILNALRRARNDLRIVQFLMENKTFNPQGLLETYKKELFCFLDQLSELEAEDKLPEKMNPDIWEDFREGYFDIRATKFIDELEYLSKNDEKLNTVMFDAQGNEILFIDYIKRLREMQIVSAYCYFACEEYGFISFFGSPAIKTKPDMLTVDKTWQDYCPMPLAIEPFSYRRKNIKDVDLVHSVVSLAEHPSRRGVRGINSFFRQINRVTFESVTFEDPVTLPWRLSAFKERLKAMDSDWSTDLDLQKSALTLIVATLARIAVHPEFTGDRKAVINNITRHFTTKFERGLFLKEPVGLNTAAVYIGESGLPETVDMLLMLLNRRFTHDYQAAVANVMYEYLKKNKNKRTVRRAVFGIEQFLKITISNSSAEDFDKDIKTRKGREKIARDCAKLFGDKTWQKRIQGDWLFYNDEYVVVPDKDPRELAEKCWQGICTFRNILLQLTLLAREISDTPTIESLGRSMTLLNEPAPAKLEEVFRPEQIVIKENKSKEKVVKRDRTRGSL